MTENDMQPTMVGLFAKLARIMGSLNTLPKNGKNKYFDYNFVTESDVSEAIRQRLADAGIAFFASMIETHKETVKIVNKQGQEKITVVTLATFSFTFADAETGATWTSQWSSEAIDDQDKGVNKAATAALKYFLLKTFMIPTGDDPDADNRLRRQEQPRPNASKPAGQLPTQLPGNSASTGAANGESPKLVKLGVDYNLAWPLIFSMYHGTAKDEAGSRKHAQATHGKLVTEWALIDPKTASTDDLLNLMRAYKEGRESGAIPQNPTKEQVMDALQQRDPFAD